MKKSLLCCVLVLSMAGTAAAEMTHVVVKGESLSKIARMRLGSEAKWREIAQLNGIGRPYIICPGQFLVLEETPTPAATASTPSAPSTSSSSPNQGFLERMEASSAPAPATAYPAAQPM